MRVAAVLLAIPFWTFCQDGGTVEGRVLNSATRAGVGGADVTLWTQQGVHYNARTDESGAWRVSGMQPGRYWSRAEKSGFVEALHEGPTPQAPIVVGPGGTPIRIELQLAPFATVSGRVVDPEGKPAAGVEVGFGRFNTAITDDDGQFVLRDQRPGSHILVARPKPGAQRDDSKDRIEVVQTFYPSTADRAQALPIVVRAGDAVSGLEIRLERVLVYWVRGSVLDQAGKPEPNALVRLMPVRDEHVLAGQMTIGYSGIRYFFTAPGSEAEEASTVSHADGTFEFPAVRAGEWMLNAETEPKRDAARNLSPTWSDSLRITVTDHDVDDIRIRMPETFTLQVSSDWGDRPPADASSRDRILLLLMPDDGHGPSLPRSPVRSGDTLRFENVAAGRHRIVPLPGYPPGYYPAAVTVDGQDVLGRPIELSAATRMVQVLYKPNAGAVRGRVDQGNGATVLLWPQTSGIPDLVRAAQAGESGNFEFGSVAPGDYAVLAVDGPNLDRQPEAVIRELVANATPVHVDEAGSASVSLTMVQLPK